MQGAGAARASSTDARRRRQAPDSRPGPRRVARGGAYEVAASADLYLGRGLGVCVGAPAAPGWRPLRLGDHRLDLAPVLPEDKHGLVRGRGGELLGHIWSLDDHTMTEVVRLYGEDLAKPDEVTLARIEPEREEASQPLARTPDIAAWQATMARPQQARSGGLPEDDLRTHTRCRGTWPRCRPAGHLHTRGTWGWSGREDWELRYPADPRLHGRHGRQAPVTGPHAYRMRPRPSCPA